MRIGIVNDLKMAVFLLSKLIEDSGRHEVAWTAYDGSEAVDRYKQDPPDLILMDLVMPVMGGVEATRQIMGHAPCAILIVTSTIEGNLSDVFEAMGHGALDVVRTPPLEIDAVSDGGEELLVKIANIEMLIGNGHKKVTLPRQESRNIPSCPCALPPLLALGASTGGPIALVKLLSQIPGNAPFAVAVIQHLDQEFASSFVEWLDHQCRMQVVAAAVGEVPQAGKIYLAGKNRHLIINDQCAFQYLYQSDDLLYKPSVDIFFDSIANHWPHPAIGALLTGMGSDGALGLKKLRDRGWQTFAEDESSCVVYGMPKAAAAIDAVDALYPINELSDVITKKMVSLGRQQARRLHA